MTFQLDNRLAADTVEITQLRLCVVRLMNDARWPWLVLVPMRVNLSELIDLSETDRILAMAEIAQASNVLLSEYKPKKLNIGALGNIVPQLHIHVIAQGNRI